MSIAIMHLIIAIALFLGVASGYNTLPSNLVIEQNGSLEKDTTLSDVTVGPAAITTTTTTKITEGASAELNNSNPSTILSTMPTTAAPINGLQPTTTTTTTSQPSKEESQTQQVSSSSESMMLTTEPESEYSRRRLINYDQRQEGQYNIRADLDNFMIVLIPPSAGSLSLIDLLTKSALRRNSHLVSKTNSKKHLSGGSSKYQQSIKSGGINQNFNYLSREPELSESGIRGRFTNLQHDHHHHHHAHPISIDNDVSSSSSSATQRLSDFIEGRTPYHVDISASDDEQSRLHPNRQVDVLPPPYSLAYQHLIKPIHLEAEPTIIQALPPADINNAHSSDNLLSTYNKLLSTAIQPTNVDLSLATSNIPSTVGYDRESRAIRRPDVLVESSSNSLGWSSERRPHLPIYRSDLNFGASANYPPIDVPRLSGYLTFSANSPEFETNNNQNLDAYQERESPRPAPSGSSLKDDFELDFDSIGYIDAEAKALLRDGMERCAPGSRRDSYGVCREIEDY